MRQTLIFVLGDKTHPHYYFEWQKDIRLVKKKSMWARADCQKTRRAHDRDDTKPEKYTESRQVRRMPFTLNLGNEESNQTHENVQVGLHWNT